jgi:hypothetical protein
VVLDCNNHAPVHELLEVWKCFEFCGGVILVLAVQSADFSVEK